ncbi:hypothetical protein C7212DRAFT_339905 [Tuber magnatum]|uniref:Uncharacterized protein n=1 Tax=Tuber magnatum TaxID=42249 RepID=A0A317SFT4_9PEZI|nr:hypothetical protein C7212DRAFT_339905 [Tuber magnatum]
MIAGLPNHAILAQKLHMVADRLALFPNVLKIHHEDQSVEMLEKVRVDASIFIEDMQLLVQLIRAEVERAGARLEAVDGQIQTPSRVHNLSLLLSDISLGG